MKTRDIRKQFLSYFQEKGHQIVASSPVVPHDDPTLLFTNAGMNQFKDVFLGRTKRDYTRATTSQKCVRAGGKHNDLENVGHTQRHLTFFEMLGNFSFGDYFKEMAIEYSWEIATKVFQFPEDKIYPTVFRDDDEAFKLWERYVPKSRITRFGEKENFWQMGDVGPCGPCSELLFDRGESYGPAKNPLEDTSGERYLEFWNLVFMQYNRSATGVLEPLPKPSIDTGAGLERVMSLIHNTPSVFETDILRSLIDQVEQVSGIKYDLADTKRYPAFRVVADHLRTLAFAIADGAQPSNVERGYVLRKILRRAVRYGKTFLGFEEPFLAKILPRLITEMGQDYKELVSAEKRIAEIVTAEEEAFFRTLKRGGGMLNQIIEASKAHSSEISGKDAFKLKDTYGLPLEEVQLIAKDYDLHVDLEGFQTLEKEAKEKSKAAKKETQELVEDNLFHDLIAKTGECTFIRDEKEFHESPIIGIIHNGKFVDSLEADEEGIVILKESLFYPEMGGQVGDKGVLKNDKALFEVADTKAPSKGVIAHFGKLASGSIQVGEKLKGSIDRSRRQKIMNNHTATHILHWALHEVLGEHIKQAGSVVDHDRLRFDFSHHKPLSSDEIRAIENLVNEKIRQNLPVKGYELSYADAQKRADIKQFFGEKYGSVVRVVDIEYSKELCGGTHTSMTGNIGYFRIAKESSIAAGVRRIEAVSGRDAELFVGETEELVRQLEEKLKAPQLKLLERTDKINEELKVLQNELKALKKAELEQIAGSLQKKNAPAGIAYIVEQVGVKPDALRTLADEVAAKHPEAVIVLACEDAEKAHLFIKASSDAVGKGIKANELMKSVLPLIEGNGGGKPDSAQGAGKAKAKLKEALSAAEAIIAR